MNGPTLANPADKQQIVGHLEGIQHLPTLLGKDDGRTGDLLLGRFLSSGHGSVHF